MLDSTPESTLSLLPSEPPSASPSVRLRSLRVLHSAPPRAAPLMHEGHDDDAITNALPGGRASFRVSLTDACQLRCQYCLPGSVKPTTRSTWLSPEEHAELAKTFASFPKLSVAKVRFTGGEPLLRNDLEKVVGAWSRHLPDAVLALTTNAQHLAARARPLRSAGLQRINIHLDTLRPERFVDLMGKGTVREALKSLEAVQPLFDEVKLNVVAQRGKNDDELLDFLNLSRSRGVQVRFIELMNTGSAKAYVDQTFLAGQSVLEILGRHGNVSRIARAHPADPAQLYRFDDVVFGLISSDTTPFCEHCDRVRISASGNLRGCLYEPGGVAMRGLSPTVLRRTIAQTLGQKRSHHPLSGQKRQAFSMADVGG